MPRVDLVVQSPITRSPRVKQLESVFDVPAQERSSVEWHGDVNMDERPWAVGLIAGPSGSGKSTLLRQLFGTPASFTWAASSVIDDFPTTYSIDDITAVCQSVGFNTIPAWMRPHAVLSTGEQFRVDLARRLLTVEGTICVDEFTSVVDRQVAQIASHAVQKYIRRTQRQFVAASCHYDIIDWLQPDWVLEPALMTLTWRDLQRRPPLDVYVDRVPHSTWRLFAPFHYLTAELHTAAQCYALWLDDRIAAFAAVLYRPHPTSHGIWGVTRMVTLPDYQGLGLAFVLMETLGAAHMALERRLHIYPAHPPFVRTVLKSPRWLQIRKGGSRTQRSTGRSAQQQQSSRIKRGSFGGRPCAVFQYVGDTMATDTARALLRVPA